MTETRKIGDGTSKMPEPQTANYNMIYRITPAFMHDLEIALGDIAYVDAKKYIDAAKNNSGIMPLAVLNEFVNSLSNLPYRVISPMLYAISNKEIFNKYFELIKK